MGSISKYSADFEILQPEWDGEVTPASWERCQEGMWKRIVNGLSIGRRPRTSRQKQGVSRTAVTMASLYPATPPVPEGVFSVSASSVINASREQVWRVLTDFKSYHEW